MLLAEDTSRAGHRAGSPPRHISARRLTAHSLAGLTRALTNSLDIATYLRFLRAQGRRWRGASGTAGLHGELQPSTHGVGSCKPKKQVRTSRTAFVSGTCAHIAALQGFEGRYEDRARWAEVRRVAERARQHFVLSYILHVVRAANARRGLSQGEVMVRSKETQPQAKRDLGATWGSERRNKRPPSCLCASSLRGTLRCGAASLSL